MVGSGQSAGRVTRGRCVCGDIRYRIDGALGHTTCCHCVQCRKASGHFWASVSVAQDDLIIENGATSLAWYPCKSAERGFCVICGAQMFWRLTTPDATRVAVALGSIDGATGLTVNTHIFAGEKGDYYELPPGADIFREDNE